MLTLGTHFEKLLQNIQPPSERLDAARDLPPLVRDFLKDHKEFATLDPHTRLAGSYAQHMSVGDVKDVDFLVRVPGDPENNEPEAKQLIQDLKSVLANLPKALGYTGYAYIDVERARRSVHVYFKDHDFHIDAVPCIAPNGFDELLYVPDRGFNEWIPSHPIGYINLLNELDSQHGKKVKLLGKLLKHFRNVQMQILRPKSYWLGALLIYHVQGSALDTTQPLAVIFRDLLNAIHLQYDHLLWTSVTATPAIPDPVLGHDISWNWDRRAFETFMRRIDDGRTWATKALECETNEREEAITLWQKIFGEEYFPAEIEEVAAQRAMMAAPGSAFVGNTGLLVPTKPVSGVYTPLKGTTFHGAQKK